MTAKTLNQESINMRPVKKALPIIKSAPENKGIGPLSVEESVLTAKIQNFSESGSSNEKHYQKFWQYYSLDNPQKWSQWKSILPFMGDGKKLLEIGPGLRPKIPIEGGYFVDVSINALKKLKQLGGISVQADINTGLPFSKESFDLVCIFETLEHVDEDRKVMQDISRILKPDGKAFISFPLHSKMFNVYDETVGHRRRYEIDRLENFFKEFGLRIEQYAGQDIPWPSGKTAKILTFFDKKLSWLIPLFTKVADLSPSSAARRPLNLKPWNPSSAKKDLSKLSTGFFIMKKISEKGLN